MLEIKIPPLLWFMLFWFYNDDKKDREDDGATLCPA